MSEFQEAYTTPAGANHAPDLARQMARLGGSLYFALWLDTDGARGWDGPFPTNTEARGAVPADVAGSIVVRPLAMTPGERREAMRLMRRQP